MSDKILLVNLCIWIACSLQLTNAVCPPIISKKEWGAEKPKHVQYLPIPVDLVIIQYTATQTCYTDQSCEEVVRDIQKIHFEESFLEEIGPSFLVGGNGKLYEGRGWYHVGIHTPGYNNKSIGIAFIGTFNIEEPSQWALDAVRSLIKCGVENEVLTADHQIVMHSQLMPTESPGKKLRNKIMSWPEWKKDDLQINDRVNLQVNDGYQQTDIDVRTAEYDLILTSPKKIDFLTNIRDVIAALLDDMRKSAHQSLVIADSSTITVNKDADLFIEVLRTGINKFRHQVAATLNIVAGIMDFNNCAYTFKEKAVILHDIIEAKAKACAEHKIKDAIDKIKNLIKLSTNANEYSNVTVQTTRNCTELNFGVQPVTKVCLDVVTQQLRSTSYNYKTKTSIELDSLKNSLATLPPALEQCAKDHLLEAGSGTADIVLGITSCTSRHSVHLRGGLGYGFGRAVCFFN